MERGTVEREIHIEATPEVVFEVITQPEHLAVWWGVDARFDDGTMSWRGSGTVVRVQVVEAVAPKRFVFRWCQPEGEAPTPANSFLVTFELSPAAGGTTLRLTEEGFREVGWEAAVLEENYRSHSIGWDKHLAELRTYAARS
ncbi:SRPBCC domain-containing protein [Kutzneria buriramensis]|uniref:Uncharacterized protein YndB with AHSA1/START domain n=1 Tax=Kutzneria buriramensis TaxID=1045776 RepID=A0A3E0HES6_9PSEU|nr:SRPBCC domain-containing protein [Kutzneria buriramensis]REH43707.1 uncharacterized protein YndB with AHSA1/START domain [Kutzneria buriramensis]